MKMLNLSTPTRGPVTLRLPALLLLASSLCSASTMILPGGLSATEGNAATFLGAFFGANTTQVQVSASELSAQGLTAGNIIMGLRLRLNGGANSPTADVTIPDLEILLGQAVNSIGTMSTAFADNIIGGQLVYDGAYTFAANAYPGGASPNAFGPMISFSSNYVYQGGDLILQLRRQAASANIAIDAASNYTGAGTDYRALSASGFAATSGTLGNTMPVVGLEFSEVPEPKAMSLLAVGMLLIASYGAQGQRKKQ